MKKVLNYRIIMTITTLDERLKKYTIVYTKITDTTHSSE